LFWAFFSVQKEQEGKGTEEQEQEEGKGTRTGRK
jgi:hypothetical protein